jgi:hypothetical protein
MMAGLGHHVDAIGVASIYAGLVDTLIIDASDAALGPDVEATGMRAVVAPTIMRDQAARRALGQAVMAQIGIS